MPVVMVLIMHTIAGSEIGKFVYYLVLSILFRISFSTFEIPNNAFGAEIASGYDERTRLRTLSRIFSIIGNTLGYVMPLWVLEFFSEKQALGWQAIGCIVGAVSFASWFASFKLTKKKAMEIGRLEPVSYTHLDVYKRQALCAGYFFSLIFPQHVLHTGLRGAGSCPNK